METDMTLRLAALRAKGALVEPTPGSGLSLDVESDAFAVRTSSDAVQGMVAASATVTRLRLGLEGGYRFALEGGGALEPGFEVGVCHDGATRRPATGWTSGVHPGGRTRASGSPRSSRRGACSRTRLRA